MSAERCRSPAATRATEGSEAGVRCNGLFGSSASEPVPPVPRPTPEVRDRDNVDAVGLDAVQKTVGELRDEHTSESAAKRRAAAWELEQSFVRCLHRADEIKSEAGSLVLVEPGCRYELILGVGMKLNASHRRAEQAFLITFSAGIAATLPDLNSARRHSASASQRLSTSASSSCSRLEMRRCASRARSRWGSFRAWASSSRASLAMPGAYHGAREERRGGNKRPGRTDAEDLPLLPNE